MNEDKATRYHRLRRRAVLASDAWAAALLAVLLLSGLSRHLSGAAMSLTAGWPDAARVPAAAIAWAAVVLAGLQVGALPLAFYRSFILERRYGLSRQPASSWLLDHLKAVLVQALFAAGAAAWVVASLRWWPGGWAFLAWAGAASAAVAMAWAAPVLLLPLFYTFTPLRDDSLRDRLLALAGRAGVRAVGIFEWRLSDRTSRTNAALVGAGSTRRIVLSDTLVADCQPDEIEVVLAHELAHHVHHDLWTALAVHLLAAGAALALADAALEAAAGPLGLQGLSDPAGLPVVALTALVAGWLAAPAANAVSRAHERRADRFALELTRNADAFSRATRRIGARNLAEDAPSALTRVFFQTHPPVAERLAAARAWEEGQSAGRPTAGGA